MSENQALPDGWTIATLNQSGSWRGGGTPSKSVSRYWRNGTVHWVSPKDMKRLLIDSAQDQITQEALESSATNLIPKRSVLMVTRSGILEHSFPVGINTIPVAINQDLKGWIPNKGIDPLYVAYFLRARAQQILHTCSKDGTTVSSIDFDRLGAYKLLLAPRGEQTRIVSKIDELFSRIEEGERALERLQRLVERYRQSVLKAAVTGELTREWRQKHKGQLGSGEALLAHILQARRKAWEKSELNKMKANGQKPANDHWKRKYKEPASPDTSELPDLPEGWVWASLDMVADVVGGITVDQKRSKDNCETVPYLRVANVQRGYIDLSEVKTIVAARIRVKQLLLRNGDILFNEGGDIDKLGRGWIWEEQLPKCIHQNHVFRARLFIEGSWNKIISWYGNGLGRKLFLELGKQTTNLASLSLSKLKAFPIPLMSAVEASEIVDTVEDCFSITNQEANGLSLQRNLAASLRQAVLKAAFEGKLIEQSSTDESASVLLERIAAERNGKSAKRTAPKRRKREMVTA